MENKCLLTINVMASNRLDTTEKCLKSLDHLRKEIPCELIVTDTGCGPEMRKLIETYADRVICFEWCNDFAKARQASVDVAQGEWYLYLDDDEWFLDTSEIENFFRSNEYKSMGFATYIQRNYTDFDGENYNDTWVGRMIKLTPEVHFEDKIHEHLEPVEGLNIIAIPAIVEHYGYITKNEDDERAHYERNKSFLCEMIEENPRHYRARAHLAQEYRAAKEFQELRGLCEESISVLNEESERIQKQELSGFVAGAAIACIGLGDYEEFFRVCDEWESKVSGLTKAYLYLLKANAFVDHRKHYKTAQLCCEEYLECKAYFDKHEAELLVEAATVFVGQTFEQGNLERCYSILLLSAIKCEEYAEIDRLVKGLGWEKKNAYVYPGLLYELVQAMATVEKHDWRTAAEVISKNETLWYYTHKFALEFAEESEEKALRIFELMSRADQGEVSDNFVAAFTSQTEAEFMQRLRNAVMAYEGFAAPVKYYLEQRELKTKGEMRRKQDEMSQLKRQILAQAVELVNAGQKDAAMQIIEQLKAMMPNDLEITTLALQIKMMK